MRRALLTYFRDSGKYYSNAFEDVLDPTPWEFIERVRGWLRAGTLPGLVAGARFHTHVVFVVDEQSTDPQELMWGVPYLVMRPADQQGG